MRREEALTGQLTADEFHGFVTGLPVDDPLRLADPAAVDAAIRVMANARHGAALVEGELAAQIWLAFVTANYWQPARVLVGRGLSRSRGFPESAPDFIRMREWCKAACRGRWAAETVTATLQEWGEGGVTFWFEQPMEGHRFALKWLPMKCT